MVSFLQSEREAIQRDALSSVGKSPQDRVAMFIDLMETADTILQSLPAEERLRRSVIARQLDPLPDPWWRNFRAEALAEYQCQTSSS